MTEHLHQDSIEESLDEVRSAAKRIAKVTRDLETSLRNLDKAANEGQLAKLKTSVERASAISLQISKEIGELGSTWLMDESVVEQSLDNQFMDEVAEALKKKGVSLHRYGNGWSASPVLVRLDTKGRSVKIDRKRFTTLRPSIIAAAIEGSRLRPSAKPEQFIEILWVAYRAAVGNISLTTQSTRLGSSVQLSEVYKSLTLHPDIRRDYSIESFTRDLFLLDKSGVTTTKDGQRISLSSSTSSRGGGGVLIVLDETGAPQNYFAVVFRESQS